MQQQQLTEARAGLPQARAASVRPARRHRLTRWAGPYLFLLPASVALLLVFFYPMARGLWTSLLDYDTATGIASFGGLDNYRRVLSEGSFWAAMQHSAVWVVASVAGQFVVGFGFALLLNMRWPGNRLVRALVLIPWVMPGVSVALGWRLIYDDQFGLLTGVLNWLGVASPNWLAEPTLAMAGVIVANVWKAFPFVTVMMLAGLAGVPDELYDAAKVDGAGAWARFRHVTLPGVRNVSVVITLLMAIWTFNYFDLIFVMTGGGPIQATETAPILIARYAFQHFDYGLAAALGVVMTAMNVVFAVLYIKMLRKSDA